MFTAVIAALLSCAIYFIPLLAGISSGISVIICTVIAASLGAVLFPRDIGDDGEAENG